MHGSADLAQLAALLATRDAPWDERAYCLQRVQEKLQSLAQGAAVSGLGADSLTTHVAPLLRPVSPLPRASSQRARVAPPSCARACPVRASCKQPPASLTLVLRAHARSSP